MNCNEVFIVVTLIACTNRFFLLFVQASGSKFGITKPNHVCWFRWIAESHTRICEIYYHAISQESVSTLTVLRKSDSIITSVTNFGPQYYRPATLLTNIQILYLISNQSHDNSCGICPEIHNHWSRPLNPPEFALQGVL